MKTHSFLLVIIACLSTLLLHAKEHPMYVYVINNGQIELIINGVLVPIHSQSAGPYQVPITAKKELIIQVPDKEPFQEHTLKLFECDLGNTIKAGGFYDQNNDNYFISVLRSNKVPVLFAIAKELNKRSHPQKL